MRTISTRCLLVIAVLVPLSCGDDDAGTPPTISDLSYTPDQATTGQAVTIVGSLAFSDSEGDVSRLAAAFRGPLSLSIDPQPTQGTSGATSGSVGFQLLFQTAVAGEYEFDVWLLDGGGNSSNRLTGTLTVAN